MRDSVTRLEIGCAFATRRRVGIAHPIGSRGWLTFEEAALPGLDPIVDGSFTNVLCETVIMHLDPDFIGTAVRRLLDIVEPSGTLYLSWRVTTEGTNAITKVGSTRRSMLGA